MSATPRPPFPGPDDGLPPGEEGSITFGPYSGTLTIEKLAPIGSRYIGERLTDVPQEPFVFDLPADESEMQETLACLKTGLPHHFPSDDFDDRPQLFHDAAPEELAAERIAEMAPDQRHKAWSEWRASQQCQQLILDVAAGEVEFGDALNAAFLAGIEVAAKT